MHIRFPYAESFHRRCRRSLRAIAWWLAPFALAPLAYMAHLGAAGVPTAEGCGGSGGSFPVDAGPGWTDFGVRDDRNGATLGTPIPVATDGFFTFWGATAAASDSVTALATVRVVVKDEAGQEVAGQLKLMPRDGSWGTIPNEYTFGWNATTPLTIGQKFDVEMSGTMGSPSSPRTASLIVSGDPTALQLPELVLGDWYTVVQTSGPPVQCEALLGSCATPTQISFPGTETTYRAALASVKTPFVVGSVAWDLTLAAVDRKGTVYFAPTSVDRAIAGPGELGVGRVLFADEVPEYCVILRVRDLRTGAELASAPFCRPTATSTRTDIDYPLGSCSEPPSPELTPRWCELRPGTMLTACNPVAPTSGCHCRVTSGRRDPSSSAYGAFVGVAAALLRISGSSNRVRSRARSPKRGSSVKPCLLTSRRALTQRPFAISPARRGKRRFPF
jgi:hypothetical protein